MSSTSFTIYVTSIGINASGTAYTPFGQAGYGAPSYDNIWITSIANNSNPALVVLDGVYDAYCVNFNGSVYIAPDFGGAVPYASIGTGSFASSSWATTYSNYVNANVGIDTSNQSNGIQQIAEINWLLEQNFTNDAKFTNGNGFQYSSGDVQSAIWRIEGVSQADANTDPSLNNADYTGTSQYRVDPNEVNFLVSQANAAITSMNNGGINQLSVNPNANLLLNVNGSTAQAQIAQIQSGKIEGSVWQDTSGTGLAQASGTETLPNNPSFTGDAVNVPVFNQLYTAAPVEVELFSVDSHGNQTLVSTTYTGLDYSTGSNQGGHYQFTGLAAGNYQVEFVAPTGASFTVENHNNTNLNTLGSDVNQATGFSNIITLHAGQTTATSPGPASETSISANQIAATTTIQSVDNVDAGLAFNATVKGVIYNNPDASGVLNSSETPLANTTVELLNSQNQVVKSVVTDSTGQYSFTVAPGTYSILVIAPNNSYFISPIPSSGNLSSSSDIANIFNSAGQSPSFNLTAGTTVNNIDAGLYQTTTVSGNVWAESNFTGGSTPEQGVAVALFNTNDLTNPVASANTASDGSYSFSGILAGNYVVAVTTPSGYQFINGQTNATGLVNDIATGTIITTGTSSTGSTNSFTVSSGTPVTGENAGLIQQAHVSGSIWLDGNADGVQNGTESALSSAVTVELLATQNGVTQVVGTQTTSNGSYDISVTPTANTTYNVEVITPNGSNYSLSPTEANNSLFGTVPNGITSATVSNDFTTVGGNIVSAGNGFSLLPGGSVTNVDAGLYQTTTVSGNIWGETNFTGGSTAEQGVTVALFSTSNLTTPVATTTTLSNGNYSFGSVAPGNYVIAVTTPSGYQFINGQTNATGLVNDIATGTIITTGTSSTGSTNSFTVSSGTPVTGENAGLIQQAHVSGSIWLDSNADGVQNGTESALSSSVTVELLATQNGVTSVVGTQTTSNGSYDISVTPTANTTYNVEVITPNGSNYTLSPIEANNSLFGTVPNGVTSATVSNDFTTVGGNIVTAGSGFSLLPGGSVTNVDAGLYQTTTVSGNVWAETNFTGGSTGEQGVTVALFNTNNLNTPVNTTTTLSDGSYSFGNVAPGSYVVAVTTPSGYQFINGQTNATGLVNDIATINGSTGSTNSFTVSSGTPVTGENAGLIQQAHVSGSIWLDSNADGVQNGTESALSSSVTVELLATQNGVTSVVGTQTTSNGSYDISVTPTANTTYNVEVITPNGSNYTLSPIEANNSLFGTVPNGVTSATVSNDFTLVGGNIETAGAGFSLLPGGSVTNVDAGLYQTTTVSGNIWGETNFTGGSTGEQGVTVALFSTSNLTTPVATTTTLSNGNYSFGSVAPGNYVIAVTTPSGYQFINGQTNATGLVNDIATINGSTGSTNSFTVSSGTPVTGENAGLIQQAQVSGSIWVDSNADGVKNGSETLLTTSTTQSAELNVELLATKAGVTTVVGQQYTATGNYNFNVTPAANTTYNVEVITPSGSHYSLSPTSPNNSLFGTVPNGVTSATVSNDFTLVGGNIETAGAGFSLLPGGSVTNIDAGLYQGASISGNVWIDTNCTQLNEPNVTVKLFNSSNTAVATVTTDINGNYSFTGIQPGNYTVHVIAPAGTQFYNEALYPTTIPSLVDSNGVTNTISLVSGQSVQNEDAGLMSTTTTVGGIVWHDSNIDGLDNNSEAGIAGVKVTLVGVGASSGFTSISTTTDSTGHYSFNGVAAGTYQEILTVPGNYGLTTEGVINSTNTINSQFGWQQILGSTNLISNSSFGTLPNNCTGSYSNISGWQEDGCNFQILKASSCGVTGQTDNNIAELHSTYNNWGSDDSGCNNSGSGIYQSVQTTAGQSYQLSVDVAAHNGGTTDSVEVLWQGNVVGTINPTSTAFHTYTFNVTGTGGSNTLEFLDVNNSSSSNSGCGGGSQGSNYGAYIDNVHLVTSNYIAETGTLNINTCMSNSNINAGLNQLGIKVQEYISANVTINCGGEGQSSDNWKSGCNSKGVNTSTDWSNTGCKSTQTFNSIFGTNCSTGNQSLYQVLCSNGSGQQAFMKEAVTAYLNSSDCNISYALTKNQVVAETKYALNHSEYNDSTNEFSYQNHLGCNSSYSGSGSNCDGSSTETVNVLISDANSAQNIQLLAGTTATYTYVVTNTGEVPLQNVNLVDNSGTPTLVSGSSNGILAVGASWTYTSTATVHSGAVINTSSVTAVDHLDGVSHTSASDSVNYTGVNSTCNTAAVASTDNCTIGNQVFIDKDGNGVLNSNDCGLAGVTVTLEECINNVYQAVATTCTDANGHYEFTNLCAGQYEVVAQAVSGYNFTTECASSNQAVSSCVNSSGTSNVINLCAGQQDFNANIGLCHVASSDPIWHS